MPCLIVKLLCRHTARNQRIPEAGCNLLEIGESACAGRLVNPVNRWNPEFFQVARDSFVGSEHELFDNSMREITFGPAHAGHLPLRIEFDPGFGHIEINRSSPYATTV